MSPGTPKKAFQKLTAAMLAVWLSGIVLFLCCERLNAAGEATICPMAKTSHHCDRANDLAGSPAIKTDDTPCIACFLPAVFDKVRKVEFVQKQIAVTAKPVRNYLPEITAGFDLASAISIRSFSLDRHGTYLRNRVLRI